MKIIQIRPNGTKRVATENTEPSKTDPSYLKETDVNNIIQKFTKTGQITHLTRKQGSYADVSNATDLLTALELVKNVKTTWQQMSPEIQDRFDTPEKLIKFLQDPKNLKEAESLGLVTLKDESGTIAKSSASKRQRARAEEDVPEEQPERQDGLRTRSPRGEAPQDTKTL